MVRAKSSLILVGLLLILLPILAIFQYRWIGEVSAAEHDRLESSLRVASDRFATDFDAEFSRIANAFQIREGFPSSAAALIADRFQAWSDVTPYPRLIRAIYVSRISTNDDSGFYTVDLASRELRQTEIPETLGSIRDRFRPTSLDNVGGDSMMVVMPIFRPGRPFSGPRPEEFRQLRGGG